MVKSLQHSFNLSLLPFLVFISYKLVLRISHYAVPLLSIFTLHYKKNTHYFIFLIVIRLISTSLQMPTIMFLLECSHYLPFRNVFYITRVNFITSYRSLNNTSFFLVMVNIHVPSHLLC